MVPGIPDKKLVYMVTQSHYEMLLKNGVRIYEYTPGFNHAKNFISDDKYGVVGTINVDYRSLYLHFENGALIIDDEVVNKMKNNFLDDLNEQEKAKIISTTVLVLMITLTSITLLLCPFATIKTKAQIESLFDEVSMRIEASLNYDGSFYVNNMPLGFSSNPYDYIKNNPEYNELVALGTDAIPIIEQYISETTSFYGYILSIAIEDIAKINLKNFDEYKWSTSSTFLESWSNIKNDVDDAVYNIYYNKNIIMSRFVVIKSDNKSPSKDGLLLEYYGFLILLS